MGRAWGRHVGAAPPARKAHFSLEAASRPHRGYNKSQRQFVRVDVSYQWIARLHEMQNYITVCDIICRCRQTVNETIRFFYQLFVKHKIEDGLALAEGTSLSQTRARHTNGWEHRDAYR